jgi:small-conductance mechanosensitive channel
MITASAQVSLTSIPAVALPMQPHQIENLFWERLLPVLVVLLATAAGAAVSRTIALRKDQSALSPSQGLRHTLRALIQVIVYLGALSGALFVDHLLHGDPKGLDMTLRFGSTVAMLWAGFLAMDVVERHLHGRFLSQGRPSAVAVLPLLDKVAKGTWVVLVVLMFLENMGMDVKALLAGLGVGGLAVALAGQKTMENLFGGLVLVLDQPIRVGDFCGFGDKSGEVVEVGLRSIRLRTADRTVITVPNGEFSQLTLENFAKRDRIRFDTTLGLRLDTGVARLRRIVDSLEAILVKDAKIDHAMPCRVRFIQVSPASLDLEVFCYFNGADWEEFMLWRQAMLESLLEAMELEGGRLAPTQTLVSEEYTASIASAPKIL